MRLDLEDRLDQARAALPRPTEDAENRARRRVLDAFAERRRRRRRLLVSAPALALAATVVVAVLVAAPWRDGPLATERALAALGDQPVLHAVIEWEHGRGTLVDLESGEERADPVQTEYWYDGERDSLRVRLSVSGAPLPGAEYVHTPEGFFTVRGRSDNFRLPEVDPALEHFAKGYRKALDSGKAASVGTEVVDGRDAVILRFALPPGPGGEERSEEVAVDGDHYRPLRFRYSGNPVPWSDAPRVVEIETLQRSPDDFRPPQASGPRPKQATAVTERKLTPEQAATALGRQAFWPGRAVAGVELTSIELERTTTAWTDGEVTRGHVLVLQYGADGREAAVEGRPSLVVAETTSPDEPRVSFPGAHFQRGELRLQPYGFPLREAGGPRPGQAEIWFGSMQRDGVYIALRSSDRALLIAAAKAMKLLG